MERELKQHAAEEAAGSAPFVFVINMPGRTDRRANMRALLARCGLEENHEFVEPVQVHEVPDEYRGLTKGYLSLNLTVRDKILARAASLGAESFVVLEDDVMELCPPEQVLPRLRAIRSEVPPDWDMVYLEYCMEQCDKALKVSTNLRSAAKPYCTAGILYRTKSAAKIARCMDRKRLLIDFSYAECIDEGSLQAYIADPPLFAQDAFYAGDLAHLNSPWRIQWWLNLIIHMYPDAHTGQHYPRLPACRSFQHLLPYVRWRNVAVVLVALVAVAVLAFALRRRRPVPVRARGRAGRLVKSMSS